MHPDIEAKKEELKKLQEELMALADKHGEPVSFTYHVKESGRHYYNKSLGYVPPSFEERLTAVEKLHGYKVRDDLYDQLAIASMPDEGGHIWVPSMC